MGRTLTRAQRDRRYLDRATGPGPLCPTPYKERTFPTIEAADQFAAELAPDDPTFRGYPCPCGAIHVGHGTGRLRKDPFA